MATGRAVRHLLSAIAGCVVVIAHVSAQAQTALTLENFSERLSRDVPVSGRLLVGAAILPPGTHSLAPRLLWRGPTIESAKEPLCVTLVSRDGQYYGEGEVGIAKLHQLSGTTRLQGSHGPPEEKYLKSLNVDELAMLATEGDCRLGPADGKPAIVHVLDRDDAAAAIARGETPDFELSLMLNSLTYTLSAEASIDGVKKPATCKTLGDTQRNTAFNTICTVTLPRAAAGATVVINRRRYERPFSPVEFTLAWSSQ
jgi:hypothetical protein